MRGEDIEEQSARSSVYFMTHGSLMFSAVRYEVFCHEKALRAERKTIVLDSYAISLILNGSSSIKIGTARCSSRYTHLSKNSSFSESARLRMSQVMVSLTWTPGRRLHCRINLVLLLWFLVPHYSEVRSRSKMLPPCMRQNTRLRPCHSTGRQRTAASSAGSATFH